jgi:hypothetical protein
MATNPTSADDAESEQPDPIILHVPDIVEHVCGPVRDLAVSEIGDGALSWSGVDKDGRAVSGRLTPRLGLGEGEEGIVVNWEVAVNEATR